jgi:hypothetical protein
MNTSSAERFAGADAQISSSFTFLPRSSASKPTKPDETNKVSTQPTLKSIKK